MAAVPAFIPAYESALVVCDVMTAVVLFGQFSFLKSRAVCLLACGYLFTAWMALFHTLSFPGVFSRNGFFGDGSETAAWLYVFWHAAFPCFAIAYVLANRRSDTAPSGEDASVLNGGGRVSEIIAAIVTVSAAAMLMTLVATVQWKHRPVLVADGHFTAALTTAVSAVCALSIVALALLYMRRRSVLDLWLIVVMSAQLFDTALSALLNAARYDFGWYAGRLYGLLAASFLLIGLLIENLSHFGRLVHLSAELGVANRALKLVAREDALTRVANRRRFDEYAAAQVALAHRSGRPLSVVLFDVDLFKTYNDVYGHQAGDECLQQVAAVLRSWCRRPADMAARYGGEEFALILPDTWLHGATWIAEQVRAAVAELALPNPGESPAGNHVSISGGVASLTGNMTQAELLKVVDDALYRAKALGRNRVVAADEPIHVVATERHSQVTV